MFDDMEDPYLRSRMTDIDQVIDRIQRHLLDARLTRNNRQQDSNIDKDQKDKILIIDDLSPADLLQLQQQGTAGIISETGSPLSHTAILARSLKIPAAMGVKRARQLFIEGEKVILDGERGLVLAGAYKDIERHYKQRIREAKKHHQTLSQYKNAACRSACGEPVKLRANLDFHEDLDLIKQESVDGIGLFRTEYLFLNRQTPPEETEQFEAYAKVVRAPWAGGHNPHAGFRCRQATITNQATNVGHQSSAWPQGGTLMSGRPEPVYPSVKGYFTRSCMRPCENTDTNVVQFTGTVSG